MQNPNEEIDQLDVRSLRILKYLIESKSISKTAEYIGLSQPATSRIVAKLRKLLNDPLLVRVDHGFGLTEFATKVYPRLGIALESINAVLEADEFDISKSTATVRIASTDYGTICVLRSLYATILQQAPGITLEISNFTPGAFTMMEQGELDLAFYANFNIPGDFHYRTLFEEDYSILVRKEHPLISTFEQDKSLSETQLAGWPRAEILYPSTRLMHNDVVIQIDTAESKGVKIRLPYFLAIADLIENSDTIVALPTRMCKYTESHYAVQSLPITNSRGFTYVAVWHHRQHMRPLLRWILDHLDV